MRGGLLHKTDGTWIAGDDLVLRQEKHAFSGRLCNQHPIERVTMDRRQSSRQDAMFGCNRQFFVATIEKPAFEQMGFNREIRLPRFFLIATSHRFTGLNTS